MANATDGRTQRGTEAAPIDGKAKPGVPTLPSTAAADLAAAWLWYGKPGGGSQLLAGGMPGVRCYRAQWYRFNGRSWDHLRDNELRAEVFRFLDGLRYWDKSGKEPKVRTLRASAGIVSETIAGLMAYEAEMAEGPSNE